MPTVIDSLVVTLGLNDGDYKAGRKRVDEAERKGRQQFERDDKDDEGRRKKQAERFKKVGEAALGFFGVLTAGRGLKDFIQDTIASDAATGRLAHNLGISTEALSTWQGAIVRMGGSSKDADTSLQALVSGFQQISLTGDSALIPYLQTLGVSLGDLKNPSETLLKISDAFSKMDPARAQALGAGLGLTPSTVNLLEKGRTAVTAMLAEQRKLGVVTQADADADAKMQATLAGLTQASSRLGKTILTDAAPGLEAMAGGLTTLAQWAQRHGDVVRAAFIGVGIAAGVMVAPFVLASLPILATAAALGAVAAAVVFLIEKLGALKPLQDVVTGAGNWWHAHFGGPAAAPARGGTPGRPAPPSGGGGGGIGGMFRAAGFGEAQTQGILAGIHAESGGRAGAENGSSHAYGIGQWLGSRKRQFASVIGHDIKGSSLEEQVRFMIWELSHTEKRAGDAIRGSGDSQAALRAYVTRFMRPAAGGETTGDLRRGGAYLASAGRGGGSNSTSTVHIAKIDVNTRATDARGIAQDMKPALRNAWVPQANTGLA